MNDSKESNKWERIVVDEIFEEGSSPVARILRSKRKEGTPEDDLGINNWIGETEEFIETWRVEAFMGYPSHKRLNEGDVFFIKDGSKLIPKYTPIARQAAKEEHLLISWEESRKLAREEIKEEFARLSVASMAKKDRVLGKQMSTMVDRKFRRLKTMRVIKKGRRSKKGDQS